MTDFSPLLLWEDMAVLLGLIFDNSHFGSVVILKELVSIIVTLGGCGVLKGLILDKFHLGG